MALFRAITLLACLAVSRALTGKDHWIDVISGSDTRKALVHLPPTSPGASTVSLPLIVNFHPMGMTPDSWAPQANFNPLADKEGFIVVYPRGLMPAETLSAILPGIPKSWFTAGGTWNAGACCPGATRAKTDDVQFTKDLLSHLKGGAIKSLSEGAIDIDATRVYATGGSNGAFMTYRLACQAPELFAAVSPGAGLLANMTRGHLQDPAWPSESFSCAKRTRPIPTLITHGTWDPLVIWGGQPLLDFPSVEDNVRVMKSMNDIPDSDPGVVTYKGSMGYATCTSYGDLASNVTFCKVSEMGHAWPTPSTECELTRLVPGSFCSLDVDATAQTWEFFKRYRLGSTEADQVIV